MKTKSLLYTGIIIPIIFWLSTWLAGVMDGGYNHFTMTVSALGALGMPAQHFMSAVCILCAVLSLFFMVGMFQVLSLQEAPVLPVFSIAGFTIMMAWAGSFPSGNPLHAATGWVFLLLYAGMLLAFILWRHDGALQAARWYSLLAFAVMSLIFLRFVPSLQNQYPGLIQRCAHGGWTIWFVTLSWQLQKSAI